MTHDTKAAEPALDMLDLPRAAFESWYSEGGKWPSAVERSGEGYKLAGAQSAWVAWQAATCETLRIRAELVSDLREYGRQCAALSASTQAPNTVSERESFEAWAAREGYSIQRMALTSDSPKLYVFPQTHAAWGAWQARASTQAPASPAVERDALLAECTRLADNFARLIDAAPPAAENEDAALTEGERVELLDWVTACQSAYHIESTPNHRFGGLTGQLTENREAVCEYVDELLAIRAARKDGK